MPQVATCRGILTRPSGTGAVAGIRRPVFVRTGAARRHVLPCHFSRHRSLRHSRAVLRIFRRKGPRRERGPGPLTFQPLDITRPGFDRVPGHTPETERRKGPLRGAGFSRLPYSRKASEDLDIFRQAGEGCQVRGRDDVVPAEVEHHSAVRECRVGRDDILDICHPAGQRAGEAQCTDPP